MDADKGNGPEGVFEEIISWLVSALYALSIYVFGDDFFGHVSSLLASLPWLLRFLGSDGYGFSCS